MSANGATAIHDLSAAGVAIPIFGPNPKALFLPFAQVYWDKGMEAITQFSASEALGQPPAVVFGFYRNEYVRRNHFDIIRNSLKECVWGS